MVFGAKLIELFIVKTAEFRREAAERSYQSELRCDGVDDKAEPRLFGERKAMLGLALHFMQRLPCEEQARIQIVARVGPIHEITDPVRHFERAAKQIEAGPYVFHPAQHKVGETNIRARLEAF